MNRTLHRPEPVPRRSARRVDRTTAPRHAAEQLIAGRTLEVSDRYRTGVEILSRLDELLRPPPDHAPHAARVAFRRTHRAASLRLLAPIVGHRLALTGGGPLGFGDDLYLDLPDFFLPFVQVQELHGAWQRYQEGVHLAVLGHRIHPFYGTYVPTRVSHLELFGTWLSRYEGPRGHAVDVGTGCGVLALMLCRHRFERVSATDCNVNALESVARELARLPSTPPIDLIHGDLLVEGGGPADVIVFNPPWIRGDVDGLLDRALHYDDDLFERFFEQAQGRVEVDGRVVLLFSNLIELVQPDVPHPIRAELERGRFRLVQKLQRRVKSAPGPDGRKRRTRERVEVWELART
jgi:hypothetical protein